MKNNYITKKVTSLILLSVFLLLLPACTERTNPNLNIASESLRKEVFALVSSAENSTIDHSKQYSYIEDIKDGRGYTAGIIRFTSKKGDLLDVVQYYTSLVPNNSLKKYIPALKKVNGTSSHKGLGRKFIKAWKTSAKTKAMIKAQNHILNQQYMDPAIANAKKDHLSPLGQYIYYDALVVHGDGSDSDSFGGIRKTAMSKAKTPSQGGNESHYLYVFLKSREKIMLKEEAHKDLSRLNVQRKFIKEKNWNLKLPLSWTMYGDHYYLTQSELKKL